MIKTFISHSSKQKDFAKDLVNSLGASNCILDCYDFEPAKRNIDEIYKGLDKSSIFVLLLSEEALNSDWVMKLELPKAKELLDIGKLEHLYPYIIDSSISFDDSRIPVWLKKGRDSYNLQRFNKPFLLARDLKQKYRNILWDKKPELRLKNDTIVGRNDTIEEIESELYSGDFHKIKSLILSGREGVGRRTIIKKFIKDKQVRSVSDEIFLIELSNKESIEDFIMKVNDLYLDYDKNQLMKVLAGDKQQKLELAIELLNKLGSLNDALFILDRGACVLPNRKLSEWFADILRSKKTLNRLNIFLISTYATYPFIEEPFPEVISIQVFPLSKADRYKLFYAYYNKLNLPSIDEQEVYFFIDKLHGSPLQIFHVIDSIKKTGLYLTKKNIKQIIDIGDKEIIPIMKYYENIAGAIDVLILLSKFEFISYTLLEKIIGDNMKMDEILDSFIAFSIIESFGPNYQYLKLDSGLSDFIARNRMPLANEFKKELESVVSNYLKENDESSYELVDVSEFMFNVQQALLKGHGQEETYLIPSFFVKTIISLYYKEEYDEVIKFSDKILKESVNYYDEIIREITYWLCQALAKKGDRRFFKEVGYIDGLDNLFLKGFFYRCTEDYINAEKFYQQVLDENPTMPKACREMVSVLLRQKRFHDALSYAKNNYENKPNNTYHIHAYFRCLVRKKPLNNSEKRVLKNLIEAMKNSYDIKKIDFYMTMESEYMFHVDSNVVGAISKLKSIVEEGRYTQYAKGVLEDMQKRQDM